MPVIGIAAGDPILSLSLAGGTLEVDDNITASAGYGIFGGEVGFSNWLTDPSLMGEVSVGPQIGIGTDYAGLNFVPLALVGGIEVLRLESEMTVGILRGTVNYSGFLPDQLYLFQVNSQFHQNLLLPTSDWAVYNASWRMLFDQIYSMGFDPTNQPYWDWRLFLEGPYGLQ